MKHMQIGISFAQGYIHHPKAAKWWTKPLNKKILSERKDCVSVVQCFYFVFCMYTENRELYMRTCNSSLLSNDIERLNVLGYYYFSDALPYFFYCNIQRHFTTWTRLKQMLLLQKRFLLHELHGFHGPFIEHSCPIAKESMQPSLRYFRNSRVTPYAVLSCPHIMVIHPPRHEVYLKLNVNWQLKLLVRWT